MPETESFGVFGTMKVERDDEGFVEIPVIIEESGLYFGSAPAELRIHTVGTYGADDFNKAYVAKLNRHTDLPFYLGRAKVKIIGKMEKITDEDIKKLGIQPLKD